jgi:translation initiation factor 4E
MGNYRAEKEISTPLEESADETSFYSADSVTEESGVGETSLPTTTADALAEEYVVSEISLPAPSDDTVTEEVVGETSLPTTTADALPEECGVNEISLPTPSDDTVIEDVVGETSLPPRSADTIKPIALHSKWTIWYDNPRLAPAGSDWTENLKQCGSFDTVESFWRIFNNLKPASELSVNSNYSVFRDGVQPSWEDPANAEGGKFVYALLKKDTKLGKCDEAWLFTVLAMIGETMDRSGDQINGAVVSIRKQQDRVTLWLKSSDRDICIEIGERWKKVLNCTKYTLRYQTHRDAAASGRSFRNEAHFEV